jgi:hypothetical protein
VYRSEQSLDMDEQIELLREMRNLLLVIAEPELAKRDERLRRFLLDIAGKSRAKAQAVLLMDGSRSQTAISKASRIDPGNMSRLVKALRAQSLIAEDERRPKLVLSIPPDFFENTEKRDG